jgi:di/tricarboxylate transporter
MILSLYRSSSMTADIAIVLILLLATVLLFATERLSVDVITLLALCVLTGTRILTPTEAFAGFSSELLVMLGAIFVLGGALQHNGVPLLIAGGLHRLAGKSARGLTVSLMLVAASASAFMNNTTVAAIFVPPASGLARRSGVSASKLLMPLAFAAILGGTCTLIGTSTNIAVSGYLERSNYEPLGMFEILPIGLVLVGVGIVFMITIGWRLLPDHENDTLGEPSELRDYLAEVCVLPGSPLIGERALDWGLAVVNFRIVEIVRQGETLLPDTHTVIEADDTLIVHGAADNLRKVAKIEGLDFRAKLEPEKIESGYPPADIVVAEAIILPGGELTGASLKGLQFYQRYGMTVLALHRSGTSILANLSDETLNDGDVLLLHGPTGRLDELRRSESRLRLLGDGDDPLTSAATRRRGWIVIGIFVAAILVGSAGLMPMSAAFLSAAVLVIMSGCIPADRAHEFIDWRLLILIGGMPAFGAAMENTATSELLASGMLGPLAPFGVVAVLAGFLVLTVALTQPMSNAAAALVVLPVAMSAATTMGSDPRTFAIGIMLAASVSFIAPLEPACLLVYGPGKYHMVDFIKIGGLLTITLMAVILTLLKVFWTL